MTGQYPHSIPMAPAGVDDETGAAGRSGAIAPVSRPWLSPAARAETFARVLHEVSTSTGVDPEKIMSHCRQRSSVYPRQEIMWTLRTKYHWTLTDIARALNKRDHTVIVWGIKQHAKRLAQ